MTRLSASDFVSAVWWGLYYRESIRSFHFHVQLGPGHPAVLGCHNLDVTRECQSFANCGPKLSSSLMYFTALSLLLSIPVICITLSMLVQSEKINNGGRRNEARLGA